MTTSKPFPVILDPHYSPSFYAEMWGVSADTVIRWFEDEPGVLKSGKEAGRGTRRKITLRIPWTVATRVYQERTKGRNR